MLANQLLARPAEQALCAPIDGQDYTVWSENGTRIVGVLKEIAIADVVVSS
jgi:hypothetical protein